MLRLSHAFGVDSKLKVYAADKHGRRTRGRRRASMLGGYELSVEEAEREEEGGGDDLRWCDQTESERRVSSPTPV